MEIFNIHIFEFVLIAGLALVVFGPERLPEVGRFLGKQLARLMAWQQQSPELQMLNEVRGEFEREIASLRDELVRTRSQLDISSDVSALKKELQPMLNLRDTVTSTPAPEPSILPPTASSTASTPAPEPSILPSSAPSPEPAVSAPAAEMPPAPAAAETASSAATPVAEPVPALPSKRLALEPSTAIRQPGISVGAPLDQQIFTGEEEPAANGTEEQPASSEPDLATQPDLTPAQELLLTRLTNLIGDLQVLVGDLQAQGLLDPNWQAPSQSQEQESITP